VLRDLDTRERGVTFEAEVKSMRAPIRLLALGLSLSAAVASADLRAGSSIQDGGGFFSPAAITEGNHIVEEIRRGTRPPKGVTVVTVAKITPGRSPKEVADQLFRDESLDGLLVFAVKEPGRLEIVVGKRTEQRFTAADRDAMLGVMLERFKKKQFDEGLLAGLRFARDELLADFPAGGERAAAGGAPKEQATDRSAGGLPGWAWLLLIVGGVWLLIAFARTNREARASGAPASGGYPPQAGYGGGSFGRSLLGGLFGAMAGQWLYDRWTGHGDAWGSGGRDDDAYRRDDASDWSDRGDIGGSSGGDFYDSSDSGGGDSGGDDSGGGDF
jgi:uncharacterized protein